MRTIIIKTGPRGPKGDTGEQGPAGQAGDVAVNALVTTSSFGEFTASIDSKVDSLTTATSSYIIASQTSSFVTNSQTSSFVTNSETGSFVTNSETGSFVTNSETGSFISNSQTSSMTVLTSSFAISSSFISDTFISASAVRSGFGGGGGIASVPAGTVSSSAQLAISISGSFTAPSASFSTRVTSLEAGSGQTSGLVSSSAQLATEISGAFGSASSSLAGRTTTLEANPVFSETGISGSWQGQNFISASQVATNLPTGIVSGSAQISYASITNVPAGIVSSSAQISYTNINNVPVDIISGSEQLAISISGSFTAPSASFSTRVTANETITKKTLVSGSAQISYTGISDVPAGIVSSSTFPFTGDAQITGSLTISGSFSSFTLDSDNIVLGSGAGLNMGSGADDNVIVGHAAGNSLTSGDNNVMIGSGSGAGVSSTSQNIFIGGNSGQLNSGQYNISIGIGAGRYGSGTAAQYNVAIGRSALQGRNSAAFPSYTVAVGASAGFYNYRGEQNTFVGYSAGYGNTSDAASGNNNVGIGPNTLYKFGSTADNNIAIGQDTGYYIVLGSNNILIGSGSYGTSDISNQLKIGNQLSPIISGSLSDGGLKILGQVSASSYIGDGSNLTGVGSAAGTVSSSAQLATPISGAFAAPSASFSTRVTDNTSNISTNISNITSLTNMTGSYASTGSVAIENLVISNFTGSTIPGTGATSSIAVTVVSTGDGNKYVLDGTITASISLIAGDSYKFDQSDSSNGEGGGHPFRFSTDTGGSSQYTTGVTVEGSPGSAGAFTQISVTNSTPILYYYCTNHGNMGLGGVLSIVTGSLIQQGSLQVSGSTILTGSVDIFGPINEDRESVIRSQRPIVTVATNPFTASAANVGQYFRVGGDITCSIFTTASVACPIGGEFDFFQTSSANNMLFETASGVTLNSKNGNLNLAGQFSSATLKRVGIDEWDLMGDLT